MANFEETVFIIQFVLFLVLLLIKLYNVLNDGKTLEIKHAFVIYALFAIMYGIGLFSRTIDYENHLMGAMFGIQRILFVLGSLFLFIEIIFHLRDQTIAMSRPRYKPQEFELLPK